MYSSYISHITAFFYIMPIITVYRAEYIILYGLEEFYNYMTIPYQILMSRAPVLSL